MQIPYIGTEYDSPSSRATRATTFSPAEVVAFKIFSQKRSKVTPQLLGYKEDKQDSKGHVPEGFIIYLAWQIVPGLLLGDYSGAKAFWNLEAGEREEIRAAFNDSFLKIRQMGISPFPGPKKLVWDAEKKVVYFFGFRDWTPVSGEQAKAWDSRWLCGWDLVKLPRDGVGLDWDGNTEGGKL
ncbi:uncharacterized protein N7496_004914 [Penicillium cataractarum]|uniref:Uncharacterized protein n=1 Tax=Penicillium cataractarum TaxID=2100454 RepID=A0A9W9SGC4_9EURO|nr:uncharacterized protein N7496_004914 [Penicillium cataractarum]KAJ5377505.1 hypothetical protein N7496_004914 [Penicillium cataractarum]